MQRLDIPDNWRIHPVISVDHLERFHQDTFDRQFGITAPIGLVDYQVEAILAHTKREGIVNYLVKFKSLSSAYNQWLPLAAVAKLTNG